MKSTEHRKSLIGIFVLAFILTFFVDRSKPIELNFWGVRIEEGYIWLSIFMAQLYFCVMAYSDNVFSGLTRGADKTLFQYVFSDPGVRHERVGQFMLCCFAFKFRRFQRTFTTPALTKFLSFLGFFFQGGDSHRVNFW